MQVALHTGAHFTDESKLVKSLAKNDAQLSARGIIVPQPRSYRRQLRDILDNVEDRPISLQQRSDLLQEMVGSENPDRVILSNSNFFGVPRGAVRHNRFYHNAADRLADFAALFGSEEVEIFMAIRDPATFLPALVDGSPEHTLDVVIGGSDPLVLRWSELILRIREALPQVPVTVWCNEDTPLIWEELLRDLAGLEPTSEIEGGSDLVRSIMSREGFERLNVYLDAHPELTEIQKRRVVAAFLDKFAIADEVEEELDLPGWTEELVEGLTESYDEDVFQIERIPGVTLITP